MPTDAVDIVILQQSSTRRLIQALCYAGIHCSWWHLRQPQSLRPACSSSPQGHLRPRGPFCLSCCTTEPSASTLAGAVSPPPSSTCCACSANSQTPLRWGTMRATLHYACNCLTLSATLWVKCLQDLIPSAALHCLRICRQGTLRYTTDTWSDHHGFGQASCNKCQRAPTNNLQTYKSLVFSSPL